MKALKRQTIKKLIPKPDASKNKKVGSKCKPVKNHFKKKSTLMKRNTYVTKKSKKTGGGGPGRVRK